MAGRAVAADERAIDQRIAAGGVADQRQGQVRPVVQVDREPVPAAAADRDEVAPLVVEPGLAVDRQALARRGSRCPWPSWRSASSSTSRRRPRSRSSRRGRAARAAWSRPASGRGRAHPVTRPRPLRPARGRRRGGRPRRPRSSSRPAGRRSRGSTGRCRSARGRSRSAAPSLPRGERSDLRPHLEPLGVDEAVAGLVGDREVRCPRGREGAALGAEDDVLEPEPAARPPCAGGPCRTTTRSGGRAGRRPAAGPTGSGSATAARVEARRRDTRPRRGRVGQDRRPGGAAGEGGCDDREPTARRAMPARRAPPGRQRIGPLIGAPPRRPTLGRRQPVRRRALQRAPASTSSSGRGGASWPGRGAPGRPWRRGRPRSPCPPRAP